MTTEVAREIDDGAFCFAMTGWWFGDLFVGQILQVSFLPKRYKCNRF